MVDKISCIAALVVLVLLAILIYKTVSQLIRIDQVIDDNYDHHHEEDINQQKQ